MLISHARKDDQKPYDIAARLNERAEWIRTWAEKVASIIGDDAKPGMVHLYEAPNGLPEMRDTFEAAGNRKYVGAFTPEDAERKVREMLLAYAQR